MTAEIKKHQNQGCQNPVVLAQLTYTPAVQTRSHVANALVDPC